jgi:hypothetical protein
MNVSESESETETEFERALQKETKQDPTLHAGKREREKGEKKSRFDLCAVLGTRTMTRWEGAWKGDRRKEGRLGQWCGGVMWSEVEWSAVKWSGVGERGNGKGRIRDRGKRSGRGTRIRLQIAVKRMSEFFCFVVLFFPRQRRRRRGYSIA